MNLYVGTLINPDFISEVPKLYPSMAGDTHEEPCQTALVAHTHTF